MKQLLALDGVEVGTGAEGVTYWHFMFDAHQIVFANGAATESMFTGPEAIKALSTEARAEIQEIFPDLFDVTVAPAVSARALIPGNAARKMASRMQQNGKPVVTLQ